MTLSVSNNSRGVSLVGSTTVTSVAGVATFSNVSLETAGPGFELKATAPNAKRLNSTIFAVKPGPSAKLAFTIPPSTAEVSATFGRSVEVHVQDIYGNLVPSSTASVSLRFGANPGAASLGGMTTRTSARGVAFFADVNVSALGSGYTLVAECAGLAPATSSPFDIVQFAEGPRLAHAEFTDIGGGPQADQGDLITMTFNRATNGPSLSAIQIAQTFQLPSGNSLLSGSGAISKATWSGSNTVLTLELSTAGGAPTITDQESIEVSGAAILGTGGLAATGRIHLRGSLAPTPVVHSLDPAVLVPGEIVEIHGANFSPTLAQNAVTFAGQPATILTAQRSAMTVTVPAAVTPGTLVVTSTGLSAPSFPYRTSPAEISLNLAGANVSAGMAINAMMNVNQVAIADGGHVIAFVSRASNHVAGDTNGVPDVFCHDVRTGVTTRVSLSSSSGQANGTSERVDISGDGRFVVFSSAATNLVPGTTHTGVAVYLRDRLKNVTTLVSRDSSGAVLTHPLGTARISGDGRYVLFGGQERLPGRTALGGFHFRLDRSTNEVKRCNLDSAGNLSAGRSLAPELSADGELVVFASYSSTLVFDDTNTNRDFFLHDFRSGRTELVSAAADGLVAPQPTGFRNPDQPRIGGGGRYVVFVDDGQLNAPNPPGLFVRDRHAASTTWLTAGGAPAIDTEAKFLFYAGGSSPTRGDIYQMTLSTGATTRLTSPSDGSAKNGLMPRASRDGRHLVYLRDFEFRRVLRPN